MNPVRHAPEADAHTAFDPDATRLLNPTEERQLLRELGECKDTLAEALARLDDVAPPAGADDPQALAHYIAETFPKHHEAHARLGAVYQRYNELRNRLAMANMRLVAHVAKRFRDRGVSYSDLLQEGFCGLLEAIDRFDLHHQTKLATYATWWIRQAMQGAVASGAYPVRLSPRHLRQLAQNQEGLDRRASAGSEAEADAAGSQKTGADGPSTEMIRRIHTATRPTVSLDASIDTETNFSLMQVMSDPEAEAIDDVDTTETIEALLDALRPRERRVLAMRFGLDGEERMSLSQVGKVLEVSKERVRQIQDRALEKLREAAVDLRLLDPDLRAGSVQA